MAAAWQDLATQQAEVLSDRLRELLSTGLGLLRSELGVDVGLNPELYPTWVILLTAFLGLLVIVVFWVAACGGIFGGKKQSVRTTEESNESTKASVTKAVKTEEQKKKNKKKPAEKSSIVQQKAQPNGRTVVDLQEDAKGAEENLKPFPAEVKTEKSKKNKKKPKTEVKQTKTITSTDGKEPDEGNWETKVSNREKRQQRKKDKQPEDSGSLGGGDPPASAPVEQPRLTVSVPAIQRKSKGEAQRSKAGKGEAVISQVSASWSEPAALNGGGWNDKAMKLPAQALAPDAENWSPVPKAAGRRGVEATAWSQEMEGSWSGGDRRRKTDRSPASFTPLGLKPTGEPQPASNLQRDTLPKVDDEWSGLNGMMADPGSDWNAPSELWGNFEEPQPERPAPPKEPAPEAKGSEDEKEKGDGAAGDSGKPKKKKKKKKKQDDAGATPQDSGEPEKETSAGSQESNPPVKEKARSIPAGAPAAEPRPERPTRAPDSISQKPSTQVPQRLAEPESTAKQNSAPAPAQKKHEENWESPKQVKKKRARRET
ncbi:protein LYRIC-like isoform X1 [Anguilla anguilla]|uniref:protein LYRIC-like isoform X1 n=1 Tax=Anguilla anguilla TaxID=7936 RepID=UPI0015AB80E7|nr:protein LYRIC-like isoform X1 [Anguilla anguilla]